MRLCYNIQTFDLLKLRAKLVMIPPKLTPCAQWIQPPVNPIMLTQKELSEVQQTL